jgi:hypothetical protein
MLELLANAVLNRLFKRIDLIRPDEQTPYLNRWVLWDRTAKGGRRCFLHCFLRSDNYLLHDHSFDFWSLVLWGGYYEDTFPAAGAPASRFDTVRGYRYPLSVASHPASFAHRVILPHGKKAWTLVWAGPKIRQWGFFCPQGWKSWLEFDRNLKDGRTACAD